jgi:hypothetical protein
MALFQPDDIRLCLLHGHVPPSCLSVLGKFDSAEQVTVYISARRYPESGKLPSTDQQIDDSAGILIDFLTRVHNQYGKPIWLTEFALVTYDIHGEPNAWPSQDVQEKFLQKAAQGMNSLSFVDRYSWFDLPPWKGTNVNLFDGSGAINNLGKAFQAIG